jgi:hypothetical protein
MTAEPRRFDSLLSALFVRCGGRVVPAVAVCGLALTAAGCENSPTEPPFPVEGSWVATTLNGGPLPALMVPNPDPDCQGIFLIGLEVVFEEAAVQMVQDREDWCFPLKVSLPQTSIGVWAQRRGQILVWSPPSQTIADAVPFEIRGDELEWTHTFTLGSEEHVSVIRLEKVAGPDDDPGAGGVAAARALGSGGVGGPAQGPVVPFSNRAEGWFR